MNPAPVTQCLECGATLSPSETQGLCARCLLKMGLASQFGESPVAGAGARALVAPPMFPFDFGGYRVLRLLGRGGMGAVYEAEQRETGRRVALKVLGQTIDSPEMRKRFLREGRLAAAINHPNSVYIFGTEEIEGAPVIAMELVAGGTLKDELKRRGPLPVRDAVDAILGVIAGLEAAHAGGVLHRDVKPANCFVAPDGTVKVGDFGLSVSTLARHDSQLTATGTVLGTPSYAAPEQLRSDDLDLRADIYSTGATLYSLLTGHAPFEGDNAVRVVAAVLNDAPTPIAAFRKDVPAGLAQIVARCLSKGREERFASYNSLREALLRFSSRAPEPAPLGLRFVAGCFDLMAALLIPALVQTMEPHRVLPPTIFPLFFLLYFGLSESLWGASPCKALCGLCVIRRGGGAPGLWRVWLRGLLFIGWGCVWIYLVWRLTGPHPPNPQPALWCVGLVTLLSLPVWNRKREATLHDLLTGTQVVVRSKEAERPRLAVQTSAEPGAESGEHLGPFRVLAPIAGEWFAGRDEVLRRNVWIRKWNPGSQSADARQEDGVARRDPGRAGRLRWIVSGRGPVRWEAFDAPTGQPLLGVATTPQPWAAVRCWLLDLAEELDAAAKDGTLPLEIGLDQGWITAGGRALLLDKPWPGVAPSPRFSSADFADAQRFLNAVAMTVVDRTTRPLHAGDFLRKLRDGAFDHMSFLAGNLRALLAKPATLSRQMRFASLALVPGLLLVAEGLMHYRVFAAGWRRDAGWAPHRELRTLPPALAYLTGQPGFAVEKWAVVQDTSASGPDGTITLESTGKCLAIDYPLADRPRNRLDFARAEAKDERGAQVTSEGIAKYISGHFGTFIESAEFDRHLIFSQWPRELRDTARAIVREHPTVSAAELAGIDARLDFLIADGSHVAWAQILASLANWVFIMGVFQLIDILVRRRTDGQALFGFAVVDMSGNPASRLRLLWRWFGALTPLFLLGFAPAIVSALARPHVHIGEEFLQTNLEFVPAVASVLHLPSSYSTYFSVNWPSLFWTDAFHLPGVFFPWVRMFQLIFVAAWVAWLTGFIAAIVTPARGLHDRLAGTRLVPR